MTDAGVAGGEMPDRFIGGMNVPTRLGRMNATVPLAELRLGVTGLVLHPRWFGRLFMTDFVVPLDQVASAARLRGRLMTSGVVLRLKDGTEAYFWTWSQQDVVLVTLQARGVTIDPQLGSAVQALRPWSQQRSTSSSSAGVQPVLIRLMPLMLLVAIVFMAFVLTKPSIGPGGSMLVAFWIAALVYNIRLWLRARK